MGILVLQPAARDEGARRDQRLDDRVVGVALVALVGEDALALEAGRVGGERAVFIDGVGDARVDPALGKQPPVRHPQVEVLAAVARRSMNKARARVIGDVIAGEQRDMKFVPASQIQRR